MAKYTLQAITIHFIPSKKFFCDASHYKKTWKKVISQPKKVGLIEQALANFFTHL
jgi:hypothetical protein